MLLVINGVHTVLRVDEADTIEKRLIGLIGKGKPSKGLLFRSCGSVHTFFMRYPIDVILLDAASRVLDFRTVVPGRIVLPQKGIRNLLELPAGSAAAVSLKIGDILSFVA